MRKSIFNTVSAFIVALILSFASLLLPLATSASPYFPYGEGTEEDPYKIANCNQLQAIENDLDAYYELLVNIDCNNVEFNSIGDNTTPFSGYLYGNNKIINNLNIEGQGLFGETDSSVIVDLTIKDAVINGIGNIGSLAGVIANTEVHNVHSTSSITTTESLYVGGLIGEIGPASFVYNNSFKGTISGSGVMGGFTGIVIGADLMSNNYSLATITVSSDPGSTVGGFVGSTTTNTLENSYAITTIDASNAGFGTHVGGFAGMAGTGTIQNSFADMTYTGSTSVGDFVGIPASPTFNNLYFGEHGNGCGPSVNNSACISVDVTSNPNYFKGNDTNGPMVGWDFENTWEVVPSDYPRIIVESAFGETSGDMNGDNIDDSYQATVIGVPDDNQNLTVVELNSDTDCTLDPVGSWIDSGYYKEDVYYPLQIPRMTGFTVYCPNPGSQVLVTLVYPEEYDTSDSVLRFYNDVTNEYHNVSGVTFETREVNGNTVTTATYLLKDGSINDTDGEENGVIQDPVGIAVNNEQAQSSSSDSGSQSSSSSSLASTGQQNLVQALIGLALVLTAFTALAQLKYSSRISRS